MVMRCGNNAGGIRAKRLTQSRGGHLVAAIRGTAHAGITAAETDRHELRSCPDAPKAAHRACTKF